uniref:Uncharacterized protein n=1 Tax=Romanomermis culicivorax TaxID=13658 RepID=A0A915L3T8_ROMCU
MSTTPQLITFYSSHICNYRLEKTIHVTEPRVRIYFSPVGEPSTCKKQRVVCPKPDDKTLACNMALTTGKNSGRQWREIAQKRVECLRLRELTTNQLSSGVKSTNGPRVVFSGDITGFGDFGLGLIC